MGSAHITPWSLGLLDIVMNLLLPYEVGMCGYELFKKDSSLWSWLPTLKSLTYVINRLGIS